MLASLDLPDAVDRCLLDGKKDLYIPVLDLVKPYLRPVAFVLADNSHGFKRDLKPQVEPMQGAENGFLSATL